jgi:hypothetical protein
MEGVLVPPRFLLCTVEYMIYDCFIGLEHRIARDIFDTARTVGRRLLQAERAGSGGKVEVGDGDGSDVFELSVTFLELLGKSVVDLAGVDGDGHPLKEEVPIREDSVSTAPLSHSTLTFHTSLTPYRKN